MTTKELLVITSSNILSGLISTWMNSSEKKRQIYYDDWVDKHGEDVDPIEAMISESVETAERLLNSITDK